MIVSHAFRMSPAVSEAAAFIAASRARNAQEAMLCFSHDSSAQHSMPRKRLLSRQLSTKQALGHGLPPAPADRLLSCPMQIASALEGDSSLVSLDVGGNNIEATGITALANALKGNANLKSLELGYNPIKEKGAQALADVVKYDLKVSLEAAALLEDTLLCREISICALTAARLWSLCRKGLDSVPLAPDWCATSHA